jgi:hypothetical protein
VRIGPVDFGELSDQPDGFAAIELGCKGMVSAQWIDAESGNKHSNCCDF